MKINTAILAATLLATLSTSALAGDVKIGNLTLENPVIRATVPGAKVAGGYLLITNHGKTADWLIGGSADFAQKIEIHEMAVVNDVMKMRKLAGGLEIPAGGSAQLMPGSYHVMFIGMKEQMKKGEKRKAELEFKNAGKTEVEFDVQSIAETMKINKMGNGMMKGKMKMDGKMKMPGN